MDIDITKEIQSVGVGVLIGNKDGKVVVRSLALGGPCALR